MVNIIHNAYLTCVTLYSWRQTMWIGHGYGHHSINLKQGIIFHPNLLELDVVMKAHEHNDIMHVIGNIKVPHIECVKHLYVCIHVKELYSWIFKEFFYNHFKFGAYNESICWKHIFLIIFIIICWLNKFQPKTM
jgi:hypothetical protein